MKKFIGAICSGVAGILTFVWLSLDWFTQKFTMGSLTEKEGITGWNLITNKVEGEPAGLEMFKGAYTLHRVAAIAMLVIACLLIVSAVVLLLKNLNVIKCKFNFNIVNNILLTLFVVAVILAIVGVSIMGSELCKALGNSEGLSAYAGIGAWLALAFSVVACGCGWALARKSK